MRSTCTGEGPETHNEERQHSHPNVRRVSARVFKEGTGGRSKHWEERLDSTVSNVKGVVPSHGYRDEERLPLRKRLALRGKNERVADYRFHALRREHSFMGNGEAAANQGS